MKYPLCFFVIFSVFFSFGANCLVYDEFNPIPCEFWKGEDDRYYLKFREKYIDGTEYTHIYVCEGSVYSHIYIFDQYVAHDWSFCNTN